MDLLNTSSEDPPSGNPISLKSSDKYRLSFAKTSLLGAGSYGKVFKAYRKADGKDVAVKVSPICSSVGIPTSAIREIALLRSIRNPNVVAILDVIYTSHEVCIVLPFYQKTLQDLIEAHGENMPIATVGHYSKQLLAGLRGCHVAGIMHRDLKPANVLFDPRTDTLALADLGISRRVTIPEPQMTSEVTTLNYRAPEILQAQKDKDNENMVKYGFAIDVWSCACIIIELLTGQPLFMGQNETHMLELIKKALPFTGVHARKLPRGLHQYLSYMLSMDPSKRPNCTTIINSQWFASLA